ncbi:hypothetical protein HPB49_016267 [Dermacentor silvarum]|uniref:Uncharacterized protein n=1 Tax=Dermacentor silvarum TaxID=543639 RepID=A0ACB8D6J5_DERSI|nr:hypothetical protein HPB49_016267 [Dermacentor silvarum]
MSPPTKKRKFLSLEEKAKVIAQAEGGKRKSVIAEEFGIPASSLSTILKCKDAIAKALASGTSAKHKKVTQPVHEDLDKAVYTWFVETRAKKIALSGDIVRQKALNYACLLGIDDFKASVGWLNRFKSRHSIIGKVLCGEAASADSDGAAALLLNTQLGRETKVDLFMALQMIAASWCATRSAIIRNCFRHAGFSAQATENSDSENEDGDGSPSDEVEAAWAALLESGDVPAGVHPDEYIQADSCVVVREEMTDEDILNSVREDCVSSDEDDAAAQREPGQPTTSQVMDAFDTIRRSIGTTDNDQAMALLAACENLVVPSLGRKRKQAKLTDFWH